MTGCEACSALVNTGDTSCAICGADLQGLAAGKRAGATQRPKVDIPVRRYGQVPPPRLSLRDQSARHAARRRSALVAVVLTAGLAGGLAAWLQFG
ncbi:hypothetical protein [Ramlibacter sp.]|uniref:hypothetical protein n=1 Tax=Ramlibacter sp. TaxID=1917967 RepID=UPI002FC84D8C